MLSYVSLLLNSKVNYCKTEYIGLFNFVLLVFLATAIVSSTLRRCWTIKTYCSVQLCNWFMTLTERTPQFTSLNISVQSVLIITSLPVNCGVFYYTRKKCLEITETNKHPVILVGNMGFKQNMKRYMKTVWFAWWWSIFICGTPPILPAVANLYTVHVFNKWNVLVRIVLVVVIVLCPFRWKD